MAGTINGFTLAYTAAGAVIMWSGIKGWTIENTFRSLLTGTTPTSVAEPIPTSTGSDAANSEAEAAAATGVTAGAAAGTSGGTAAAGDTAAHGGTAAANQAIGKLLAAKYGWSTGTNWTDLVSLWNQESGWNNLAQNPTSTAYGIAQFLDTTWAPYGPKTSDPSLQIKYGLEYIKDRYGSPTAAWAHEVSNNWY